MDMKPQALSTLIHELRLAGMKLYNRGYVVGASGNISGKLTDSKILIKASGRSMGSLKPSDLVIADLSRTPPNKVSSDYNIHRELYLLYPQIRYVVHAHPKHLVELTLSEKGDIEIKTYEGRVYIGEKLHIYHGDHENVAKNSVFLSDKQWGYVIEAGHGVYVFGSNLNWVINMVEELEYIATTHLK